MRDETPPPPGHRGSLDGQAHREHGDGAGTWDPGQLRSVAGDPLVADLARLAARICGTPTSLVTLLDDRWAHFLAAHGMDGDRSPVSQAFCRQAPATAGETLVVPDTRSDARFADNPLVTGAPHVRFYAGATLAARGGRPLGTLCVLDQRPRDLPPEKVQLLRDLSSLVADQLEAAVLRLRLAELGDQQAAEGTLRAGLVVWDSEGTVLLASDGFAEMVEGTTADLEGQPLARHLLPEDLWDLGADTPRSGRVASSPLRHADGRVSWVRATTTSARPGVRHSIVVELPSTDARPTHSRDQWTDAVARARDLATRSSQPALERVRAVMEATADVIGWPVAHLMIPDEANTLKSSGIWHVDPDAALRMTRFVSATSAIVLPREAMGDRGPVVTAFESGETVVRRDITADPTFRRGRLPALGVVSTCAVPLRHDGQTLAVLEFFDEVPATPTAAALAHLDVVAALLARTLASWKGRLLDDLTGLAGRQGVVEETCARMLEAPVDIVAVGLQTGDLAQDALSALVVEASRRLRGAAGPTAAVGIDGRILVATRPRTGANDRFAEVVTNTFVQPRWGRPALDVHVGTLSVPSLEADHVALAIDQAIDAMQMARLSGSRIGRAVEQELHESHRVRTLRSDLHHAVARDQLRVHLQPIVHTVDGTISGFEALLRWEHPQHGSVSPAEFIPWAEESGIIDDLGGWVARTALAMYAELPSARRHRTGLSINLAAAQLADPDLIPMLREALEAADVPPDVVTVELTETMLMVDPDAASVALAGVKELGVRVAIDDFGTGYSSLEYLQRLPIDRLKIDRVFIDPLPDQGTALAEAIVHLAHSVGLTIVAEGVETPEQHRWLVEHGCQLSQGWLYAPALPAAEALSLDPTSSLLPAQPIPAIPTDEPPATLTPQRWRAVLNRAWTAHGSLAALAPGRPVPMEQDLQEHLTALADGLRLLTDILGPDGLQGVPPARAEDPVGDRP